MMVVLVNEKKKKLMMTKKSIKKMDFVDEVQKVVEE